ncbi:hypothetical protein SLEP1_g42933 [Rubroshorea leprosula]|uniref:Phorbol-ester/DAG-type domain-containing protein n=1 Tax=Rubroshorea leprosula TaxID=152421 RepID=A0AAV5LCF2_9ROSI|nr:hypothetical protein SLEP1_g42933 [Rubroshorea leprosula]
MKLNHFSHPHPLVLVEDQEIDWISIVYHCSACKEVVEGSSYTCSECEFCLHKSCAELSREINHPFHPSHRLILYEQSQYPGGFVCNSCRKVKGNEEFVYHCSSCQFDLDIRCALLPKLITGDFPKLKHFSHEDSLFFLQNHYIEPQDQSCSACEEPISGPVYCCFDCLFFLHQKCFELPLEIKHPSHRKHSLALLPKPPNHPEKCSCHLCTKAYNGFIYYCSLCEFGIMIKYTFPDKVIKSLNHEHPFVLVSKPFSFICNACGIDGEYCFPYVCTECDIAVHKDCISLPQKIKTTRHKHPISHTYFLANYEGGNNVCGICWDEINLEYGSYHCLQCDYLVHVNCATEKYYFEVQHESKKSNEALKMPSDEWASMTGDLEERSSGDQDVIATEIMHFSHQHNLILSDEIKDICCDGCIQPISSTKFYYCTECDYSLHKRCVDLARKTRQWSLKTTLTLHYNHFFVCNWCGFFSSGFGYQPKYSLSMMCIRCFEVPENFTDRGHKHPLFFHRKYKGKCSGCGTRNGRFRCKYGDFALCRTCIVLPHTTWYKYDKHPLALTYHDDHDVDQCYCDICEEPRDPSKWFYHCEICKYSVHPSCVLGRSSYVKLGLTSTYDFHQHPLTFVKEEFDDFPCNDCSKRCENMFLKCSKSDCNYAVHCECRNKEVMIIEEDTKSEFRG